MIVQLLAEQIMSLNIQYKIGHILLLVTIIVIPLGIIYSYEAYKLDIGDADGYLQLIQQLSNKVDKLRTNLTFTEQYTIKISELEQKRRLEGNSKQSSRLLAEIESNIHQNNVIGVYSNFIKINIINVLIFSQFCLQKQTIKSHVLQGLNYITNDLQMSLKVVEWQQEMSLTSEEATIFVIFREFRSEFIEENVAARLKNGEYRNQYYLKEIAKQLRTLPSFSHCKYTNYHCSQRTVFFVHHSAEKSESYWKIDKEILIVDQTAPQIIFTSLSEALSVYEIMRLNQIYGFSCKQLYADIQQRAYLQNTRSTLSYLSFIFQSKDVNWSEKIQQWLKKPEKIMQFIKKGKFRSPYLHNKDELQSIDMLLAVINNNLKGQFASKTTFKFDVLSDDGVGVIDMFPNDFKIGVYVPLLVLFLTPLMSKLLELIRFIIKTANGKQQSIID